MYEENGPIYPTHVDHVLGVGGPPPRHDQLLHQLLDLLLGLKTVQIRLLFVFESHCWIQTHCQVGSNAKAIDLYVFN